MESLLLILLLAAIALGLYYETLKVFSEKQSLLSEKLRFITRLKENSNLCVQVSKDLVELLNFDYCVVSIVDFNNNLLKSIAMYAKEDNNLGIQHPKNWIEFSEYSTIKNNDEQKDILLRVIEQKKRKLVISNLIYNDNEAKLNKDIFNFYGHEKLARLYIPVIHANSLEISNELSTPVLDEGVLKYFVPNNAKKGVEEVENKAKEEEANDIIIGVIELGIKSEYFKYMSKYLGKRISSRILSYFFLRRTSVTLKIGRLLAETYADSFAQIYYENYFNSQKKYILNKINPLKKHEYKENEIEAGHTGHDLYAYKVLREIAEWQKANIGILSFKTFNNNFVSYSEDVIHYNITRNKIKVLTTLEAETGITAEVCLTGKPYYSNDVKNDEIYVNAIEDVNSELILPLIRNDEIIGVISLSSFKKNAFDRINIPIIEIAIRELINQYIRRKRYSVYFKLTNPEKIWHTYTDLYKTISDQLKEYFFCNYITAWRRNESGEQSFELVYSTDEKLSENLSQVNFDKEELAYFFENEDKLISLKFDFEDIKSDFFKVVNKEKFKFFILLKISNGINYEGFFILFSKQDIFEYQMKKYSDRKNGQQNKIYGMNDVLEQSNENNTTITKLDIANNFILKDLDFLEQVARKVAISTQNIKMTKSIKLINESLLFSQNSAEDIITNDQNENLVLKKIVFAALEATNSDIITLYIGNEENKEILKKDAISISKIKKSEFDSDTEGRALLANIIIKDKTGETVFTFTNDDDYFEYIYMNESKNISNNYKLNSFRTKNNIKTSIAIKLKYEDTPIGIMFFNYTKNVDVSQDSDLRKLILDFSNVAAVQVFILIKLKRDLTQLNVDRINLKNENIELEKQKDQLNADLIKTNDLLEEIIPAATRTSFYLILHAVNHDVGNILQALLNTMDTLSSKNMLSENGKRVFFPYKNKISNTIEVLHNLLDLFDFTDEQEEKQKKSKKAYDINEIIRQLISFFKNIEPDIEFKFNLEEIPYFNCNKMEISMVIYNLINNATYFIKAANRKYGLIIITTKIIKKNIEISIFDNGTGIDSSNIDKIYKPRFTTKPTGVGLGIGLYFVQQIIENTYKGDISVQSTVNRSTTFLIKIPEYIVHISK